MRFSFIVAIVAFVCSLIFKDPVTDNAGSMLLFLCSMLSGFIGLLNKCTNE